MVINLLARIPGLPQRNEDHLPPPFLPATSSLSNTCTWGVSDEEKEERILKSRKSDGEKVCWGRPGRVGVNGCWFTRGCREIDKQISRGLPAREGKHVRIIKIHLEQSRGAEKKRAKATRGTGGQEIAAKQAWRAIKGWFCMKTSGKGRLTIRGSKMTKKKRDALPHNGGLYTRLSLCRRKSRVRVSTHAESYLYKWLRRECATK